MIRIWSRIDLGICRKYDLFVTSANNEPLNEFQIVQFKNINNDFNNLENLYNTGEITNEEADKLLQQVNHNVSLPLDLVDEVSETFGNVIENKKRVSKLKIDDLV